MKIPNIRYNSEALMFLVVSIVCLLSCNSSTQPAKIDNELYGSLIDAYIYSDSGGVHVKNADGINITFPIETEEFIQMLLHDRSTNFISFEKCSTISSDQDGFPHRWKYEFIVWDYEHNISKSLFDGESYNGEGLMVHYIYNYDWESDNGIGLRYGWEWSDLALYENGLFKRMSNFPPIYYPDILAFLDGSKIIVRGTDEEYSDTYSNFIYNYALGEYTELSDSALSPYSSTILADTGFNINPDYGVNGRPRMSHLISWNNSGTAYLYSTGRLENGRYGFILYNVLNDEEYNFESGSSITVKWKE